MQPHQYCRPADTADPAGAHGDDIAYKERGEHEAHGQQDEHHKYG